MSAGGLQGCSQYRERWEKERGRACPLALILMVVDASWYLLATLAQSWLLLLPPCRRTELNFSKRLFASLPPVPALLRPSLCSRCRPSSASCLRCGPGPSWQRRAPQHLGSSIQSQMILVCWRICPQGSEATLGVCSLWRTRASASSAQTRWAWLCFEDSHTVNAVEVHCTLQVRTRNEEAEVVAIITSREGLDNIGDTVCRCT